MEKKALTRYSIKKLFKIIEYSNLCELEKFFAKRLNKIEAKDIDEPDYYYGYSPLQLACCLNKLEIVKFLHKFGVNLEIQNHEGYTPFHLACARGNLKITSYLYKQGVNIENKDKNGATPFLTACGTWCLETITFLHELGVNIKAEDNNGANALHYASFKYEDVLEDLELSQFDNSGYEGICASDDFHYVNDEYEKIVKYLHKLGIDINAKDNQGNIPTYFSHWKFAPEYKFK
jgi:ankyrin repeat protein